MQVNREIDPRLTARGTQIFDVKADPGTKVWKLVYAEFYPAGVGPGKSGGRHHAYVEAIDESGNPVSNVPFRFAWSSGSAPIITNGRSGFDAANQPFSEGRNAFSISKEDGDTVNGIGMGQDDPGGFNAGEHTSTLLRYQRLTETGTATGPVEPPVEPPPTEEGVLAITVILGNGGVNTTYKGVVTKQ